MKYTPDFVFAQAHDNLKYERVNLRWIRPEGYSVPYQTSNYHDIRPKPFKQTLEMHFQGRYVKASLINQNKQPSPRTKRSTISDFSSGSRGRLFDLFNQLEIKRNAIFVTLTYTHLGTTASLAKRDLRAFFKRVERMFPKASVSGIWRMEFQERGAIHFHIVFFKLPYVAKEKVQEVWGEITNQVRPFTRIEMIYAHKKLINYVSKYVAKVNAAEEIGGFNPLTYLSAYKKYHGGSIGRVWGYLNKKELPFAPETIIELPLYFALFMRFRDMACNEYPRLKQNISPGFKLYVPSAKAWKGFFHRVYDIKF